VFLSLCLANCNFASCRACHNVTSPRCIVFISKALLILAKHRPACMPCRSVFPVSSHARRDSANSALVPQRIDCHGDRTCSTGPRKHLLHTRSFLDLPTFEMVVVLPVPGDYNPSPRLIGAARHRADKGRQHVAVTGFSRPAAWKRDRFSPRE